MEAITKDMLVAILFVPFIAFGIIWILGALLLMTGDFAFHVTLFWFGLAFVICVPLFYIIGKYDINPFRDIKNMSPERRKEYGVY